jgi:predicted helicase
LSRQLINEYRAELDRLRQVSGSRRESVLREAFKDLLKRWGKAQDLQFVPEHEITTAKGNRIYADGALLHGLRVPFGYWEAKDADDKLDDEIAAKFRKGYPKDNIIFSDDVTAVLWQDGSEAMRAPMDDAEALLPLLTRFFAHERAEIADFKKAVAQFGKDLPAVLESLREMIQTKRAASSDFARAQDDFLKHARDAINPAVTEDDVQEMLIQHILTEDIFAKVFDNPEFHQQNNVAKELYALEGKLFGYGEKTRLLKALAPYYAGIDATASLIESHSEKQGFLKALYENFYKVYNPLAADRLGVVYTPGEIVRFMIRSADWLCEKHFGKNLIDKGVEILDPATGTGTFIVELLEHFRGNHEKLRHKYKEELHANEVAILPYYVANLNIEATYQAITGQFAEYPNLCFVDTLDNVAALGKYAGYQGDMFGGTSEENMARVKRQNERKISVIIGNPPYNAWQENYNAGNANRPYKRVDERIRQTYIREGTAQNQNSVYDMYTRFVRWASDRLGDEGIICFIMGRKPISKAAYDGFRKVVEKEFSEIWLVDLGGDVRDNPQIAGTTHNVFGIQTGVTVAVLVRQKSKGTAKILYARRPEFELKEDKLSFLSSAQSVANIRFETIVSDRRHDWLDQTDNDWISLLPLADPTKGPGDAAGIVKAIFRLSSNGVKTQRNEWVWALTRGELSKKVQAFIYGYESVRTKHAAADRNSIKWDAELDAALKRNAKITYGSDKEILGLFRPFSAGWLYFDSILNGRTYRLSSLFQDAKPNATIAFRGVASQDPLATLATTALFDLDLLKTGNGTTQGVPRYRYTKSGERVDNITDWALAQFVEAYQNPPRNGEGDRLEAVEGALRQEQSARPRAPSVTPDKSGAPPPRSGEDFVVTKDAIFAYCYAVLHDPVYREKYALNLKREFPRIPFYPDFEQWVEWGEKLLELHIGYEKVKPFNLTRTDTPNPKRADGTHPKPKLKSNPEAGNIVIDEDTQLSGIPHEAWDYRLGNRSGIDWVLDQHKEKTPRDPTIRAKFNSYRFADYKESCIDLLGRVVTVSLETVAITDAMKALDRSGWG